MSDTEGEEKCAGSLPPLSDEGISDTIEVHQRVDILDGDMNVVMANCGKVSFVGVLPAMDEEGKTWVGVDLDRPLDDYAPCDVRHLAELPWHFFPLERCRVAVVNSTNPKVGQTKVPRVRKNVRSLPPAPMERFTQSNNAKTSTEAPNFCKYPPHPPSLSGC